MSDPETRKPVYFGAAPTPEGWVVFYSTPEMNPEDAVGAAHLRPGIDFESGQKGWAANEISAAESVFDGFIGLKFGEGGQSLDQIQAKMLAIEFRSFLRSQPPNVPPGTTLPNPKPGTTTRPKGPASGSGSANRATAPKPGVKPKPGRGRQGRPDGRRNGSRMGKVDGNSENNPIHILIGAYKAFVDGIGELGFMMYDSYGTQLEYATMGKYQHDYISLAGRALGEDGKTVGDLIDSAVDGATDSTVNALRDLGRGDFYAFGYEAPGTPVVSAMTGALGSSGLSKLRATGKKGPGPGKAGGGAPPPKPDGPGAAPGRAAPEADAPDFEDWSDLRRELRLDEPGTHANAQRGERALSEPAQAADAAQTARALGWIDDEGGGIGSVGGAFQKHGHASKVREGLDLSGGRHESAHTGAAVVLEQVDGYVDTDALTQLMPRQLHRGKAADNLLGYDPHWKSWIRDQQAAGNQQMTLRSAFESERAALDRAGTPVNPNLPTTGPGANWMTDHRRGTLQWKLELEYTRVTDQAGKTMSDTVSTATRRERGVSR